MHYIGEEIPNTPINIYNRHKTSEQGYNITIQEYKHKT